MGTSKVFVRSTKSTLTESEKWEKWESRTSPKKKKKFKKKIGKKRRDLAKQKTFEKIKEFQDDLKRNATPAEQCFEKILIEGGFGYEFQKIFKTHAGYKIADFYLPDYSVVIEIDGEYHDDAVQKKDDKKRERALLGNNKIKKIFRFSNEEVLNSVHIQIIRQLVIWVCPEAEQVLI